MPNPTQPVPDQPVLDFLLTRRSRPWRTLSGPAPSREALETLLTAAARVPDHGKLEPWRFIVLQAAGLERLAALARLRGGALGMDAAKVDKIVSQFEAAPLIVAVISAPVPSEKVPEIEQVYCAGAVCLGLLNAAHAAGWAANWLSGFVAHDRGFLTDGLELKAFETVAGFVHIGSQTCSPSDRPRPDLAAKTKWVSS